MELVWRNFKFKEIFDDVGMCDWMRIGNNMKKKRLVLSWMGNLFVVRIYVRWVMFGDMLIEYLLYY